jgi:hypothetical protein
MGDRRLMMNKPEMKAECSAPKLEVFGSVRNLTGGSTGTENDGRRTRRAL